MQNSTFRILIAVALLLTAATADAEGVLLKSEPKNNAEIAHFDGNLKLWFSGNVSEKSPSLVVVDSRGNRVDNHDTRLVLGERHRLTATTAMPLAPDHYAARYRVITEDGLVVSGVLKFAVVDSAATQEAQP